MTQPPMVMDGDRSAARAELARLKQSQTGGLAALRALASKTRADGDELGANLITLQVITLSRTNLRIAAAKRKIERAAGGLGPAVLSLRALADEADAARRRLANAAQALEAATQLIEIVGRLASVLSPLA